MGTLKIKTTSGVQVKKRNNTLKLSTVEKPKNDGAALGYLGARVGIGAAGIFEGIGDFVQGSVYQLMGDKEYAKYLHMNDVTGSWRERLDKNYNPAGVMVFAGDVAEGIGQAIPSLAVGAATGGLGAAAGAIGSTAIGAGYAGRGITSAVQQTGELGFKENAYGTLTGSLEAVTDKFLGGVQKAGKSMVKATSLMTKAGAKSVARKTLVRGVLSSAGSEALEEFIQEYADTALLKLTKVNREAEFSFQNALYSALIGGITGGIMGGVSVGVRTGTNYRIGDDIRKRGLEEQLLKTADFVRDEHLGNVSNFDNVTDENLKALVASVDAYRKLKDKSSSQGAIILGEIKRELLGFEMSAGVDRIKGEMMKASSEQREALAKSASGLFGKTVTAEDIATNKDGVTRRLALESFVHEITTDTPSATDIKRSQINEAIAAERLPYIKQSVSWDGQGEAAYRDPKSGKYVFIDPAEDGTWRMAYSPTAVYDENNLMIKDGLDTETVKKTLAGLADGSIVMSERGIYTPEALEREKVTQFKNTKKGRKAKKDYKRELKEEKKKSKNAVTRSGGGKEKVEGRKYSLVGTAEDGRRIYQGNFPKGTPKIAKSERILKYIKNVWSKKPIRLLITNGETSRYIFAHFDPTVDETQNTPTDASKLAGGNRHGNHTEQRVTLDLADDYYEIASESKYNYSKYETGKTIEPHQNVKMWHYFINEIYFIEQGESTPSPYTVTINVKEKENGDFVYSFNAEKEFSTRQTLHAAVNTVKGANGELFLDNSIPQNPKKSTEKGKKDNRKSLAGENPSTVNPSTDSVDPPPFDKGGKGTDKGGKGTEGTQEGSQSDERGESGQESVSEAQEAAESENASKKPSEMSERERKRGYSDKEANAARALVKDFDTMSREKRLSIIEMMRSAESCGASKTFMKHAAAMIGYWRKGLWIIADDKTSERGFYQSFSDGSRLIVVNPKKKADKGKSAIDTAFVHELAHDIWDRATAKTRDALYRMATEGASAAEVEDIRKEYRDGYEARGLELDDETLREEVFTNLIGKTLGNEAFLERFDITPGRMTAFKRSIKAVTRMAKCFFGKDRYLYGRCEKMARSLIRVMGEQAALEAVLNREVSKYIRYSTMNDASFEENVESIMKMEDSEALRNKEKGNFIKISNNTPRLILEKVQSAKDLQLIIRFDALYLALRKSGVLEGHYHNLGSEILNNLIDYIETPDAIVVRKDGRLTVVSSFSNDKGKNGIISIELDTVKDINSKYDSYNLVVTIFTSKDNYLKNSLMQYGESVAYEKEDLSQVNPQLHKWLAIINDKSSNISIPQNPEKSTENAKKSFSFDPEAFIQQSMENGGMIEQSEVRADTAKSQTAEKKADTEAKLKAKVEKLKEDKTRLEREARASERKAKNAEKREAALGDKMEQEKAREVKRIATSVKKLVNDFSFLVNEATHRKYTDGGAVGATILADPAIQAFAAYFAKRGSAYNIMNKSTRDGVRLLLEFYNPNNPIFSDEGNASEFFGENSKNIFSSYRPEVAEMIKSIAEGEGDLSLFEMQQIGDIVRNIRHIYENYDAIIRKGKRESAKVMSARSYEAQTSARKVLGEGGELTGRKKIFKIFKEAYLYTVVTPEEVLRDLENHVKDPVLSELYRDIRLGEAEAARIRAEILTPITEFLAKKENKEFFDGITKPTLDFGGIKISVAQAVSIYETSKRTHAQQRLYDPDGGIKIYDAEKSERVDIRGLTETSIDNLYSQFDDTAKEYIKHLEAAMAACKKYKVDTDYAVMGFTNAIDGHYYPITTDPNYFAKDITDIRQSMGIEDVVKNKSFNKNTTKGAQAPLVIEDSQRVLERHVFGIGQYAGLYIPLQNFGKVYGTKFDPSIPAEEQNRVNDMDKLRAAAKLTKKISLREFYNSEVWVRKDGTGALDSYLTKLFADIQRIKPGETSIIDRAVEFIRSGYVNSVFGLNPKIIFTQLASYPAAFRVIDVDCLARAVGMNPFSDENRKAMDKYSRITLARNFDGSNAADGLVEKLSELGKKTSIGIEYTDRGVILSLYSACQLQIEKDGGAKVGSVKNLKAAAELLDNVLLDTQTTSLMSDRSALARDRNEFAKMLSMFRNEAVKSFSNFYGSIGAYIDHKKLSEVDESYGELLDEDTKKIARNVGAYLGSSAVVASISIIAARLRSSAKDEEEKEKIGAMVAKESVEMVFDLFPIVSDAAGFMLDGYAVDSIPLEVLNDVLSTFRGTSVLFDVNAASEEKAKYLRNTAFTAGKVLGLPVQNAARLASTTVSIMNKPLAYKMNDSIKTKKTYKSDLDRALASRNTRLAETITRLWVSDKMTGKASEEAVGELVRLYSVLDEQGNRIFKYPKVVPSSLTAKEQARFMEIYSQADDAMGKLLLSKEYKALDDKGKVDAVKKLYNEYYKLAEAELEK